MTTEQEIREILSDYESYRICFDDAVVRLLAIKVKLPEKKDDFSNLGERDTSREYGWNSCLEEVKRLNGVV